jgi:hypothetical protein
MFKKHNDSPKKYHKFGDVNVMNVSASITGIIRSAILLNICGF